MVARYVVLAGSICLAIAACSPKENIATEETLTEKTRPQTAYREIDVRELLINTSDLEDVIIILAQQRTRENGAIEQRAYYEQRNYIEIKRLPESGNLFPRSVIDGESGFDSMSRRLRKDFGVLMISHTNPPPIPIYEQGVRGGWLVQAMGGPHWQPCAFARIGLRSDSTKAGVRNEGYDTVVLLRECGWERTLEEIAAFLARMRSVPRDYKMAKITR